MNKLFLLALFLISTQAQSDDDDSVSGASGISGSPDSPDEPTLSPSQQALSSLIRACPCFEELGGDDDEPLSEVREECLDDGSGTCSFFTNTANTMSTLNCVEDQIVLDTTTNTCQLNELPGGGNEETYALTAAQTAICQMALAGVSSDFSCTTPAPTASPSASPSASPTAAPIVANVCQSATATTSVAFAAAGATDAERMDFAFQLITQAVAPASPIVVTIDAVTENPIDQTLTIEYTLCSDSQANLDAAFANIQSAIDNGLVFEINGIQVSLLGNVLNTTTAEPLTTEPTTPAPSTPAPVATPSPTTPSPTTPSPTTPSPTTPSPTTPSPTTPSPTTPVPTNAGSTTPAPITGTTGTTMVATGSTQQSTMMI